MAELPNRVSTLIRECNDLVDGGRQVVHHSKQVKLIVSPASADLTKNNLSLNKVGFKHQVGKFIQSTNIDGCLTAGGCRAELTLDRCHLRTVKSKLRQSPLLQLDAVKDIE